MKQMICIPLAFLVGLAMGNWGSHSDLQQARQELDQARIELKVYAARRNLVPGVTGLLGIGTPAMESRPVAHANTADKKPPPAETEVAAATGAVPEVAVQTGTVTEVASVVSNAEDRAEEPASEEDREAGMNRDIETAAELWEMRVQVARSAFLANTGANNEQSEQFDLIMGEMNGAIETIIIDFSDQVKDAETVQMEASIRLANEITGVMVESYNAVDGTLDEGWRRQVGEEFSLVNFIDPRVGKPMVGLDSKMQNMGNNRQRSQRRRELVR